jgi:hypothetical protein
MAGKTDVRELLTAALAGNTPKPSEADEYAYLLRNWGDVYVIVRPSQMHDTWKALARFGNGDELHSWSADGLLTLIRHHYGPATYGYPFKVQGADR